MSQNTQPRRESLPTLFAKLPPTAQEAEVNVIGAIFRGPRVIADVCEAVSPGDFTQPDLAQLFRVLVDLHQTGQPIEPNAVLTVMQAQNLVAGEFVEKLSDRIIFCIESTVSAAAAAYYARQVRACADRRKAINVMWDGLNALYTTAAPTEEVADATASQLMAFDGEAAVEILTMPELIEPAYLEIQARAEAGVDKPMGLGTGLPDIDNILGGLEEGSLTVVAARTSVGKTAFAQQVVEHIAASQSPAGSVSLEMSRHQLAYRLMASKAPLPNSLLRRPTRMTDNDWTRLNEAVGALQSVGLFTAIAPGCTLEKLMGIARRMHSRGVRCLMIDHLGLMRTAGRKNSSRNDDLGEITKGIKYMALDLKISVVLLCQLNRIAATEKPALHHLRESGHIEEDADNVVLLWRPMMAENTQTDGLLPPEQERAVAIIAKNRQGPTAEIDMVYFPPLVKFGCVARGYGNAFGRT